MVHQAAPKKCRLLVRLAYALAVEIEREALRVGVTVSLQQPQRGGFIDLRIFRAGGDPEVQAVPLRQPEEEVGIPLGTDEADVDFPWESCQETGLGGDNLPPMMDRPDVPEGG